MTFIRWQMQPERNGNLHSFKRNTLAQTNIRKADDYFRIEMAVPGLKKENFLINLDKDILIISYDQQDQDIKQNSSEKFLRKEFEFSGFNRQFTLPEIADKERISAKYESGILTVIIPFEKENKMSKKINVN
jgi:HSP20 family protein